MPCDCTVQSQQASAKTQQTISKWEHRSVPRTMTSTPVAQQFHSLTVLRGKGWAQSPDVSNHMKVTYWPRADLLFSQDVLSVSTSGACTDSKTRWHCMHLPQGRAACLWQSAICMQHALSQLRSSCNNGSSNIHSCCTCRKQAQSATAQQWGYVYAAVTTSSAAQDKHNNA
jgi:hypothetical protein